MAKEQSLSLNPTKISGLCGRLMCCLKYEQNYYEQMRREMPRVGREIATPDGPGTLVENNVLKKTCRVRITLPDQTVDMRTYSLEDIRRAEAGLPPLSQEVKRDEEGMPEAVLVSERRAPRPQQNGQNRPPQNRGEQQERQNRDGRAPAQGRQQNRRRRPQSEGGQNAKRNRAAAAESSAASASAAKRAEPAAGKRQSRERAAQGSERAAPPERSEPPAAQPQSRKQKCRERSCDASPGGRDAKRRRTASAQ